MPEFRAPRIRMPKVTLPGRAGGRATKPTASKAKTKEQPKAGNGKPVATTETVTKAPGQSAATKTAAGSKPKANPPLASSRKRTKKR
jgi:hypothetical protein